MVSYHQYDNRDNAKISNLVVNTISLNCYYIPLMFAVHGHTYDGERHIPVLLKDVAGLVPGAWEGKGRGNRLVPH